MWKSRSSFLWGKKNYNISTVKKWKSWGQSFLIFLCISGKVGVSTTIFSLLGSQWVPQEAICLAMLRGDKSNRGISSDLEPVLCHNMDNIMEVLKYSQKERRFRPTDGSQDTAEPRWLNPIRGKQEIWVSEGGRKEWLHQSLPIAHDEPVAISGQLSLSLQTHRDALCTPRCAVDMDCSPLGTEEQHESPA